jgi:hypothetical protein
MSKESATGFKSQLRNMTWQFCYKVFNCSKLNAAAAPFVDHKSISLVKYFIIIIGSVISVDEIMSFP